MNDEGQSESDALRNTHATSHGTWPRRELLGDPLAATPANVRRIRQLRKAMEEIFHAALQRDFFGSGALEFTVQDGTIQEIRQRLERISR